jgi:LacI family transcriptional regulator
MDAIHIPDVGIEAYSPDIKYGVHIVNYNGMRQMIRYLIDQGHRRIAYISGYQNAQFSPVDVRLGGYKMALSECGLSFDPDLIFQGNFDYLSGFERTLELLDSGRPFTAIACGNDIMALGCIQALRQRGLAIPGDVSVTGFDDIFLSSVVEPKLTTVRQPVGAMCACAVEILLDQVEKRPLESPMRSFNPALMVRDTVRRLSELPGGTSPL